MTVGFALCGSFCTFASVFPVMENLTKDHTVIPIFSQTAATTDSRFGLAKEHLARAEAICGAPKAVRHGNKVVANVIYRDGTVIDQLYNVE